MNLINNSKLILLAILLINLVACNDLLDKEPLSEVTSDSYFNTEKDLELCTNSLYLMFPAASIYNENAESDNILKYNMAPKLRNDRIVPIDAGSAGWT